MSCKTKHTIKEQERQQESTTISNVKDSIKNNIKAKEEVNSRQSHNEDKKEEKETEIKVKGKAETDKPLEIHEIKNGDTLQTIKVIGNAEVFIKSKNKQSNQEKKETKSETFTEKIKDFSQNIITENNIKERVSEMKKKTTEVTTKTGTFWSFGLAVIFGVVTLLIIGIIIYLKK